MQKHRSELQYSPEAIADLDDIWSYISDELQNPDSAVSTVFDIMDTVDTLQDFPMIGPELFSVTGIESDYRFLVCGSYLTIYHLGETAVYIDRVLYEKRDYIRVLFPKEEN